MSIGNKEMENGLKKIKFSIVTVCLNAESTILETIRSVKQQKYPNYEYVIWDGLSKDHTLEIIRENAGQIIYMFFQRKTADYITP